MIRWMRVSGASMEYLEKYFRWVGSCRVRWVVGYLNGTLGG